MLQKYQVTTVKCLKRKISLWIAIAHYYLLTSCDAKGSNSNRKQVTKKTDKSKYPQRGRERKLEKKEEVTMENCGDGGGSMMLICCLLLIVTGNGAVVAQWYCAMALADYKKEHVLNNPVLIFKFQSTKISK